MNTKKDDDESKLEFLIKCYSEIILESSLLYDFIEEQNINWVNDFPYVNSYLIKNIEKIDILEQKFWFNTSKKECYFKADRGIKYELESV